jgi:hypothetical protein
MQAPDLVPFGRTAAEIGLRLLGARSLQRREPRRIPGKNGIVRSGCSKQFAHQSDAPALLPQPEISPGAFLIAIDERNLGQKLQVPGNARLRLPENFGEIGHGEIAGGKQRKETHARRLARRLQDVDQRIQAKRFTVNHSPSPSTHKHIFM